MDVILQEASSSPVPPEKPVAAHFQAQLYYHIARLIYKKLAKVSFNFSDLVNVNSINVWFFWFSNFI